jgi:hypothetical protein
MNQVNQIISEEHLIQLLENFQPVPSSSFYNRMQKAPWTNRHRVLRYVLHGAVLMAAIFTILFISPSKLPPLVSTNTPTSTPTIETMISSTYDPLPTGFPPTENLTVLAPSETPSN